MAQTRDVGRSVIDDTARRSGSVEASSVASMGGPAATPRLASSQRPVSSRPAARPHGYARARMLLGRADAILGDAAGAPSAADLFLESYVAALRGAGALLDAVDPVPKRGASRSAWVRMRTAAPEFAEWSAYFSAYSAVRASIEAGSADRLDAAEADEFFSQVGRFLHSVEDRLSAPAEDVAESA
ncbi:MAG: SAV_6107 family HEPN domain-containing protein [Rhodococcus sp. (in: high G+C Gram-positive bacteria)]